MPQTKSVTRTITVTIWWLTNARIDHQRIGHNFLDAFPARFRKHDNDTDNRQNVVLVVLADAFEALEQLPHFVFMHRLQLTVSDTVAEHDDAVGKHVVDAVVVLESTCRSQSSNSSINQPIRWNHQLSTENLTASSHTPTEMRWAVLVNWGVGGGVACFRTYWAWRCRDCSAVPRGLTGIHSWRSISSVADSCWPQTRRLNDLSWPSRGTCPHRSPSGFSAVQQHVIQPSICTLVVTITTSLGHSFNTAERRIFVF